MLHKSKILNLAYFVTLIINMRRSLILIMINYTTSHANLPCEARMCDFYPANQ